MSDHVARTRPGASAPTTPVALTDAGELDRLTAAYPAFRFRCQTLGRRGARWVAERKAGIDPGLHTVITGDLAELRAALARTEGAGYAR